MIATSGDYDGGTNIRRCVFEKNPAAEGAAVNVAGSPWCGHGNWPGDTLTRFCTFVDNTVNVVDLQLCMNAALGLY